MTTIEIEIEELELIIAPQSSASYLDDPLSGSRNGMKFQEQN